MGVRTIPQPETRNGLFVAPGQVLETFRAAVWQPNTQPVLAYVYVAGLAGDIVEIWLRPALASTTTISLGSFGAADTPNLVRGCYPIPLDAVTGIPWVFGFTKTAGAGDTVFAWAYESSDDGAR